MRNDYRYLSCEIVCGDYDSLRAAFGGCSLALRLRALVAAKLEFGRKKWTSIWMSIFYVSLLQHNESAAAGGDFQGACGSGNAVHGRQFVVFTQAQFLAV